MGWGAAAINATASHINTGVNALYNLKMMRETNEANRQMNEENNRAMAELAEHANQWNWANMQAQNEWNIQQWNRENEYNSPSAQMQRLIQAGINPVSGLGGVSAGEAHHLESAVPAPANVASSNPSHYEPPLIDLSGLNAVGESAVNSFINAQQFLLKKAETKSAIKKTEAETALIESQKETQDFTNKVNSESFSVIVGQKQADLNKTHQEIENLRKSGDLTDAQKDLVKAQEDKENALKSQLIAGTKKIENETFDKAVNLYAFLTDVHTRQRQAAAAETSAGASVISANASMNQAFTKSAELSHQIEKDEKEMSLKSNQQILDMLKFNRGKIGEIIGSNKNPFSFAAGFSPEKVISNVISAGKVIFGRYYSNPYDSSNYKAVEEYNELMRGLRIPDPAIYSAPYSTTPSNPSVVNPIGESEKW